MADQEMYCAVCATEMTFAAASDDECAELLCAGCGTVIMIATVVVWGDPRRRTAWTAPQQRRTHRAA